MSFGTCAACGAPLTFGRRHCEACGHQVGAPVPAATPAPAAAARPNPEVALAALPADVRQRATARDRAATVQLAKHGLGGAVVRVGLAVDASHSMAKLFNEGVVADVVERVLAVAARLDDDGVLDAWLFADRPKQLPSLTLPELPSWVPLHVRRDVKAIGRGNSEPPLLRDVLDHYVRRAPSPHPAFVVVLSDGGVHEDAEIAALLLEAARHPVFWQFVGLGRAGGYGVLERFDTLPGRVVDNAGFFAVDDVYALSDDELYDRLLGELPSWLRAARAAGVLGA